MEATTILGIFRAKDLRAFPSKSGYKLLLSSFAEPRQPEISSLPCEEER